ncbi:hypothetical protein D9757_006624 [Collybiopsis confluens]|uniref:Uncharacterized protein n=1 Tax=Collybiopsis confluens TaxID=2823264 RepID=A0A8H5HNQ1_9AGAR|nr:hypothetical protein D9757_006624 [Collybiopsis confluens]
MTTTTSKTDMLDATFRSSFTDTGTKSRLSYQRLQGEEEPFQNLTDLEYGHSYPPTANSRRPHTHNETMGGYLTILGCLVVAGTIAVMNHFVFSKLDGTLADDHTRQFWITLVQNTFPTAVSIILFTGLKSAVSQVALYRIRSESYSLSVVSLMASPPTLLTAVLTLIETAFRSSVLGFVLLAILAQGVAITSILVPGSLTIIASPARTKSIAVPTIDLNTVDPSISTGGLFLQLTPEGDILLVFSGPSQRWQQLITRSASTNVAPTWDPPAECGLACNYTFTYVAPALNCTTLSQEDIWPGNTTHGNSSSILAFPLMPNNEVDPPEYFFYNATYSVIQGSKLGGITFNSSALEVRYLEGFDTAELVDFLSDPATLQNFSFPDISHYSARGAHCEFQNATYEAWTAFSNNTQSSRTRVVEWSGPLAIGPAGTGPIAGTNTTNSTLAGLSLAYTYAEFLNGNASFNLQTLETGRTQALNTPLFNLTTVNVSLSQSVFGLSRSLNEDIGMGLQELFGNVTLAFVDENYGASVRVPNAIVVPSTVEYAYSAERLGIVYGFVFGLALVVVVFGIFALRANAYTATFTLEQILEMTVGSSGLQELAVAGGLAQFDGKLFIKGELGVDNEGSTVCVLDVEREEKRCKLARLVKPALSCENKNPFLAFDHVQVREMGASLLCLSRRGCAGIGLRIAVK